MWGRVVSALRPALSATRSRVHAHSAPSLVTSGPAQSTAPRLKLNGEPPFNLQARAERVCNRDRDLVEAYVNRHTAMIREVYYE